VVERPGRHDFPIGALEQLIVVLYSM
jgi:hypothetical protein